MRTSLTDNGHFRPGWICYVDARVSLAIIIAISLLVLLPTDAFAGKRTYTIMGNLQTKQHGPMAGVKVQACGNTTSSRTSFWKCWQDATAFTDEEGNFVITTSQSEKKRRIRVRARFENGSIAVREYLLDTVANWIPILETNEKGNFREITFSSAIFGESNPKNAYTDAVKKGVTKKNNVIRADIFYYMTEAYNVLKSFGSALSFNPDRKIVIFYPVLGATASWTTITNTINLQDGSTVSTWLHELGHIWVYQHDYGLWACDLGKHWNMCPTGAFNEGFAGHFAGEMSKVVSEGHSYDDPFFLLDSMSSNKIPLDEWERSGWGVERVLWLLQQPALYEYYGFNAGSYQCEDPEISFEDVLSVFLPNADTGWPLAWQVGKDNYGVWRFLRRASDILPQFTTRYKNLIKARFDPDISNYELKTMLLEGCNEQRAEKGLPPMGKLPPEIHDKQDEAEGVRPGIVGVETEGEGEGEGGHSGQGVPSSPLRPSRGEDESEGSHPVQEVPSSASRPSGGKGEGRYSGQGVFSSLLRPKLGLKKEAAKEPRSDYLFDRKTMGDEEIVGRKCGAPPEWSKGVHVPEESSTDDEEELANDRRKIVDEGDLPYVDDLSYEEEEIAAAEFYADIGATEMAGGGSAKAGPFCSVVVGAPINHNTIFMLLASLITLTAVRSRKR